MKLCPSFINKNLKTKRYFSSLIQVILLSFMVACGGGGSSTSSDDDSGNGIGGSTNNAPIADAGNAQSVETGEAVTLNGSGSSDSDGDPLTYSWSFTSTPNGSSASLSGSISSSPSFTADVDGDFVVSLTVNDGTTDSNADSVTITATTTVSNTAPVADAGSNQSVTTGDTVELSGSASSDPDQDSLTYSWSFSTVPSGSSASLSDATTVSANFTPDIDGDYVVSLTVNDGTESSNNSNSDSVTISASPPVSNTAPVADAGVDQNITTGNLVNLDGSGSSDADGDSLSFSWTFTSMPSGSSASLSGATSETPSFTADLDGTYVLSLTVNDGSENSNADSVSIIAATGNSAPIASAGVDQAVETGDTVFLDGSASTDSDGDNLTYSWSFSSTPGGSSASLTGATTDSPSFTTDVDGTYTIALVVNDGTVDSTNDSVSITATTTVNNAPAAVAGDDIHINTDNSITLDGSGSSDDDGDPVTYSWTITTAPVGSTATLSSAVAESPTFTPDVDGNYAIELVVNDGTDDSSADTVLVTSAGWIINNSIMSANISSTLVNVQSVVDNTINSIDMIEVTATGVPDYQITMTQDHVDGLNNRPNASTDFVGGATSASVGDVIDFGEDLNYKVPPGCNLGYWPPGPACPSDQSNVENIPIKPQVSGDTCNTAINTMGYMLNGTAVFNWSDGASYNSQNVWSNIAPKFEFYDVDMCLGHAQQQGNYHHHMFSQCLMDLLGDDGSGHSPLHGYGADGYPIYGPYHASNVLAKSAWVVRDYDDAGSASGCGVSGVRSCQLVNQYDLSEGTTMVAVGPSTSDTETSMSGNDFVTTSGHYFEDYYYDSDLTAMGSEYLDEHNGHSHGNYGYHYHTTVVEESGNLVAAFPFNFGPTFYGELPTGGITTCQ